MSWRELSEQLSFGRSRKKEVVKQPKSYEDFLKEIMDMHSSEVKEWLRVFERSSEKRWYAIQKRSQEIKDERGLMLTIDALRYALAEELVGLIE
tara:strand:+ start:254 stop:535 length:282 start_codon:yes stop_codon:yes gene_type:complete